MRKIFAAMLVVAPLLAACGRAEEPLVPELKGRWDVLSKIKSSDRAMRVSSQAQPVAVDPCRAAYITFSKRKITMHMMAVALPVFHIADVKRDGQRLIITGGDSERSTSATPHGKLVLLLRNGEVRFDDIIDERGRSVKYERLPDGHPLRSKGATTLGDGFQLVLDVKPCKA